MQSVSHILRVPEADIYGVIGFYTLFHEEPTGESIIHICTDPACGLAGADSILDNLCDRLGITEGETTPDAAVHHRTQSLFGLCEHAPAALITRRDEGDWPVRRLLAWMNCCADSLTLTARSSPDTRRC